VTVQDTVQETAQTVQETVQGTVQTVQDVVGTTAERAADVLEETAERLRAHAPDSRRHFPWRPLLVGVAVACAAFAAAQALRMARSRSADMRASDFPADMPGGVPADEAQAKVDKTVASAKAAVTDITDQARSAVSEH
jgi:gas vesicle protein